MDVSPEDHRLSSPPLLPLMELSFNFFISLMITFFFYCGLFVLILVGFFLCCFFFHYVSAKFHLWPSSGDLPRPQIGMLSLVTVSPVITAFHSCCRTHHDRQQLWKAVITGDTVTRLSIPIRGRGKSPEEGQR